jgi:hypothetical protein
VSPPHSEQGAHRCKTRPDKRQKDEQEAQNVERELQDIMQGSGDEEDLIPPKMTK